MSAVNDLVVVGAGVITSGRWRGRHVTRETGFAMLRDGEALRVITGGQEGEQAFADTGRGELFGWVGATGAVSVSCPEPPTDAALVALDASLRDVGLRRLPARELWAFDERFIGLIPVAPSAALSRCAGRRRLPWSRTRPRRR